MTLSATARAIPSRAAHRRGADVGKQDAARRVQQRLRYVGLALVDVEAGGAERPALQRRGDGLGVDQWASAGVDQHAVRADQLELARSDQVACVSGVDGACRLTTSEAASRSSRSRRRAPSSLSASGFAVGPA